MLITLPFLIPHGHRGAEYAKPSISWGFHQHQELWARFTHISEQRQQLVFLGPFRNQGKPDPVFTHKPGGRRAMRKESLFHLCLIFKESKHSNCYPRKISSTEADFPLNSFDLLLEKKRNPLKSGATLLLQSQEEQELLTEDFMLHFPRAQKEAPVLLCLSSEWMN